MDKIIANGWKNKVGTKDRNCICGSWKNHWLKFSGEEWPKTCSVYGCSNVPTLGAHIINCSVFREYIVPMCSKCNKRTEEFRLKRVTLVRANKFETCEK